MLKTQSVHQMMASANVTAAKHFGELVVAGCDAAAILEPAEHAFDQVALAARR